ncbi:MAG: hypothetical protein ACD_56C00057G0005 [uncultured bacterium]|nr:MAG: hypothetical protein ACD_56C00057G0005 [uncultured bacterium]
MKNFNKLFLGLVLLVIFTSIGIFVKAYFTPARMADWERRRIANEAVRMQDVICEKADRIDTFHLKNGRVFHYVGKCSCDSIVVRSGNDYLQYPAKDFSFMVRQIYFDDHGGILGKEKQRLQKMEEAGILVVEADKLKN